MTHELPDYLTYASQYVDPVTRVRNRKIKKSKRPVDRRTLSTPTKPNPLQTRALLANTAASLRPAPFSLTDEQQRLASEWHETYDAMNKLAVNGDFATADKHLARLHEIEATLGFRPVAGK
jgi:hypothetical protein